MKPLEGVLRILDWCDERGIPKIIVTNAPRIDGPFSSVCPNERTFLPAAGTSKSTHPLAFFSARPMQPSTRSRR